MIYSYYYKGEDDGWEFESTELNNINLFVGASGSGKTRYLNTIFNLSKYLIGGEGVRSGIWKIIVKVNGYDYYWEFHAVGVTEESFKILHEKLTRIKEGENEEEIVLRDDEEFIFSGNKLPKLEKNKSAITLLKEEDVIKPLYETFTKVQRRNFHGEGLKASQAVQNLPNELFKEVKEKGVDSLWSYGFTVSVKLYILNQLNPELFKIAINWFQSVFETIEGCDIRMISNLPIKTDSESVFPTFVIKEKDVDDWIALHDMSSGMQKVLLIIVDVLTLPEGSIYIVDEYENSLGVNAIDFLPEFLLEHGGGIQFFITTHHPYLINNMPMKLWRVFSRKGSFVSIRKGEDLEEKYGKSKQQAFIKLINDPFYSGEQ